MPSARHRLMAAAVGAASLAAAALIAPAAEAATVPTGTVPTPSATGVIAYSDANALYLTTSKPGAAPRKLTSVPSGSFIDDVHLSGNGNRVLYTKQLVDAATRKTSYRDEVRDTRSGEVLWTSATYAAGAADERAALSNGGGSILVQSKDRKSLHWYKISTKKVTSKMSAGTFTYPGTTSKGYERPIGVGPGDGVIVSASTDVRVLDVIAGKRRTLLNRDEKTTGGAAFATSADGTVSYWDTKDCGAPLTTRSVGYDGKKDATFAHPSTDDGIYSPNGTQTLLTRASKARTSTCFGGGDPVSQKEYVADRAGGRATLAFSASSYDWAATPTAL